LCDKQEEKKEKKTTHCLTSSKKLLTSIKEKGPIGKNTPFRKEECSQ